jgi:glycine cleavage system regulatory protein
MTTSLVLTFVGDDRPGLVNAISEKVVDFGGTWLESRSVRLAGKFAGVVLVRVPDQSLIPLESALAKLAPSGLRVSVERGAAAEAEKPVRLVTLEIVGNERPGIVRDVTESLNGLGVNIEEFMSGLEGEPFTSRDGAPRRPRRTQARRTPQGARTAGGRDHGRSCGRRRATGRLTRALSALARLPWRCHKGRPSIPALLGRRWRSFPSACFPAFSRRAICTSAIISARSSASSRCRRRIRASIASSTCMR